MHIVNWDASGALEMVGGTKVAGVVVVVFCGVDRFGKRRDKLVALLNPRQAVRVIASKKLQHRFIYVVPTVRRVE